MTADSRRSSSGVTLVYFAVVFGVSVWGYRRTTTEEEFLAAGRTIGPWVGGAVLAATQISAGTFVGTLGPPLSHRRELDLDLVRRLGRLGDLGDLRRAQAAPVRRADRRRLRRHALRQRRCPHAGRGADHRHLLDPADGAVPGHRRDRLGGVRRSADGGDGRAAGQHRLLHRARRRSCQLVHRVHSDADHGAGAALRRARRARRTSAGSPRSASTSARSSRESSAGGSPGRSCSPSACPSASASRPRPTR